MYRVFFSFPAIRSSAFRAFRLLAGGLALAFFSFPASQVLAQKASLVPRPASIPAKARYHKQALVFYMDQDGKRTVWYRTGKIKAQGPFTDSRNGIWKFYRHNGSLRAQGKFQSGRLTDIWTFYYSSGAVWSRGKFEKNRRTGPWTYFTSTGRKLREGDYQHGWKEGSWTEYYLSGQIFYKGIFHKGRPQGLWTYYTQEGKIVQQGKYKEGVRVGSWYICANRICARRNFKMSDTPRRSGLASGRDNARAKRNVQDLLDVYKTGRRRSSGGWR